MFVQRGLQNVPNVVRRGGGGLSDFHACETVILVRKAWFEMGVGLQMSKDQDHDQDQYQVREVMQNRATS